MSNIVIIIIPCRASSRRKSHAAVDLKDPLGLVQGNFKIQHFERIKLIHFNDEKVDSCFILNP